MRAACYRDTSRIRAWFPKTLTVRCAVLTLAASMQVGFGVAVQYCLQQDLPACWQRTQQLATQLRQQLLAKVPGLVLQDKGRHLCGMVSFTLQSHPNAAEVKGWLAAQEPPINVSAQNAATCSTTKLLLSVGLRCQE